MSFVLSLSFSSLSSLAANDDNDEPELISEEKDELVFPEKPDIFISTEPESYEDENVVPFSFDAGLTDDETALHSGESNFMRFTEATNSTCSFNVYGLFNNQFIITTYADSGYRTAIQVNGKNKTSIPNDGKKFSFGKVYTVDGIQVRIRFVFADNGRTIRLIYDVHNTTNQTATVQIGSSADTQIGANDSAGISFSSDGGIIMEDTNANSTTYGARFRLNAAEGGFTTRWYGHYQGSYDNMYTNLQNPSPLLNTDSGIAWSWTKVIEPGETVSIRNSDIKIDNNFELGNVGLTADGELSCVTAFVPYEDTKGRTQTLYYSVDNGPEVEYADKGNTLTSASASINLNIPVSDWLANSIHKFSFYLKNDVGLTTRKLTYSVVWPGHFDPDATYRSLTFENSYQLFASIRAGSGAVISLPIDTQPGYFFMGWEAPDGTIYKGGTEYTLEEDVVLTAKWLASNTVSITVNTDDKTDGSCKVDLYQDGAIVTTFPYHSGVYSGAIPEGDYQIYVDGVDTGVTLDSKEAECTLNRYTITFDVTNTGLVSVCNTLKTGFDGKILDLPLAYGDTQCLALEGWYTQTNGQGEKITSDTVFTTSQKIYGNSIYIAELHNFDRQRTDTVYLSSPADYTKKAVYYYSCANCKGRGTETFEYGKKKNDIHINLSQQGWTYGENTKNPKFEAYNGTENVVYEYSLNPTGPFTDETPTDAGTYYIKAVVPETEDYEGVESRTVRFTINKAIPSYQVPEKLSALYGQTLADVTLPAGFKWQGDTSTVLKELGDYKFNVTYTHEDTVNYESIEDIEVTVSVQPLPVVIEWTGTENLVYDGTDKTIQASVSNTIDNDVVNITFDGTLTAHDSGEYQAEVTAVDNDKYTITGVENLTKLWSIAPKELTAENIGDIEEYDYTGKEIEPPLTVNDGEKELILNTDYTVVYQDNIKATTTAKAVVTFIGNYTGTFEKEFVINKKYSSGGASLASYKVTFDTNGGSSMESVKVMANKTLSKPDEPIKEGYVFDGWYTDKELTSEYDFSTRVSKNLNLYAKWKEADYTDEYHNPFIDVGENDWYYDVVRYVYENGLMTGITDNRFGPNLDVTRAMFIAVLYRIEKYPESFSSPFTDLKKGEYYENAVNWGYENGVVQGISDTEYAPEMTIRREQMAAMLYRYAGYKGYDTTFDKAAAQKFSDSEKISEYAVPAMNWAVENGLFYGKENNVLDPLSNVTRAEAAAILKRLIESF